MPVAGSSYTLASSLLHGDQTSISPATSGELPGRWPDDRVVYIIPEHLLRPVLIDGGRYRVPSRPGSSAHIQPETLSRFAPPARAEWRAIGKEQRPQFRAAARVVAVAAESLDPQNRAQREEEWMGRAFANGAAFTPTGMNDLPEPARSKES